MSKLDAAVDNCKAQMKKLGIACNQTLLRAVAKGLGPSLYNRDASFVAANDPKEIENIKKNFIAKKLGVKAKNKQDAAIAYAIKKIGPSNRHKQRAVFYYLIVKNLKKEKVYS